MAAKKKEDLEAEVWSAISAFEQILEAMPNDRASLDALSHAYQQIGDVTKAKEYFIRLGNVLLEEKDMEAAAELASTLKAVAGDDPDVQKLIARMGESSEKAPASQPQQAAVPKDEGVEKTESRKKVPNVRMTFNMSEELALAWNLMEAKEVNQEEYASVVQDLTEMSAGDSAVTISVLHVLEARGFKSLEKIIGFLAKQCETPYISLAMFELLLPSVTLLPTEFMVRRGAMIFDLLGKEAMAVVMNPYDKQLKQDVEALSGKKCHFFLTLPSEFDRSLQKIQEMIAAASEEAGA